MRLLVQLSIVATVLSLPVMVLANTSTVEESVLMPGSRIVAGDLSKNEFFILAGNEEPQAQAAQNQNISAAPTKITPPPINLTAQKNLREKAANETPPIKIVMGEALQKTVDKKIAASIQMALNQNKRSESNKNIILKLKTALKQTHHHIAMKKNNTKVKVSLNKVMPKAKHKKIAKITTLEQLKKPQHLVSKQKTAKFLASNKKTHLAANKKSLAKREDKTSNKKVVIVVEQQKNSRVKTTWNREPYFSANKKDAKPLVKMTVNKKLHYMASKKNLSKIAKTKFALNKEHLKTKQHFFTIT